jgi:fructuronate reductase
VTDRLSEATLARLPDWVERPRGVDRPRPGVVHLGIGAFHRAHQAVVFGDLGLGVTAASLRSPAVRDSLAPQDWLYSLIIRDGASERVRVIDAIRGVIVAPEAPQALVDALAAPETQIVTLTITEKGYLPGSDAAAFLTRGLAARRARGLRPFTAISCDNLADNGAKLRAAVLAAASNPALREWIEAQGAFPQTMVDRIVPATSEEDIGALAEKIGLVDRAMVKTEPFTQWVIEDHFVGEPPDFAAAGVQVTADVGPWEEAKLRLLNGAHSAIAYLGGLAGIAFVHDFVARPAGRAFVEALWDEAATTLSPPAPLNLDAYRRSLMQRFANAAVAHRTEQIAMDGSQKLPQRLLATIATKLDRGQPADALTLAVAAWVRWQAGRSDSGATITVDDPLAETARRLVEQSADPVDQARAILTLRQVFPERLAADARFERLLAEAIARLADQGAAAAIERFATPVD